MLAGAVLAGTGLAGTGLAGIAFPVNVPYARGTKQYEAERQHLIWQAESEIRWLNEQIPYQQKRIDTWRLQTLAD